MKELLKNSSRLLTKKQNHIFTAAATIMFTFGLSHLFGLVKTRLLISYFFGDRAALLDVYHAAYALPDTVFQLLVLGSLSAAFIPVYTRYLHKDEADAAKLAASSLNAVLLLFGLVSLIVAVLAPFLSPIIAPGFSPEQHVILTNLLRIMLLAQAFFSISGFLTAIIQSHQRFLLSALAPLVYNIGIIGGTILLSPTMGIYGPAIGGVFGAFLHMAIQLPLARSLGFRPTFKASLSHPGLKEIFRLMPPRAVALGVDQVENLVAISLSSLMAPGSIWILNVARLLYMVPASLFGVTVGQAALPALSRQSAQDDHSQFRQTFVSTLLQVIFMALPVCALFIVLRIPIVRLVFGARSFPWEATLLTGKTLAVLTLSAVFATITQLVNRGYYAVHDTKTPLVVGGLAAIFSTSLSLIVVYVFHGNVTALAGVISLTCIIETSVLLTLLAKRVELKLLDIIKPASRMALSALIMGICLWLPMRLLDQYVFNTSRTFELAMLTGISSLLGGVMYLLLSYIFNVSQLSNLVAVLQRFSHLRQMLTSRDVPPPTIPPSDTV